MTGVQDSSEAVAPRGRVLSFRLDTRDGLHVFSATAQHVVGGRTIFAAVIGPGPSHEEQLARWVQRGCSGPSPERQGFAAIALNPDGTARIAVGSRNEVCLYVWSRNGQVIGSTSLTHLVSHLPDRPKIDLQKLADLCVDYDDPQTTWFVGVVRVPPGHQAHISRHGEISVSRWFTPEIVPIDRRVGDDAPELMRDAVRDAVQASLPQSGHVAASLSGGLDSTMVAATAARILNGSGRQVHGFTHVPIAGTSSERAGWLASDEATVRRLVSAVPNLTYTPVISQGTRTAFDAQWETFQTTQAPQRNLNNSVWLLDIRERVMAGGYELMLGGQSGNLGFSWDGSTSVAELAEGGRYLDSYRLARGFRGRSGAFASVVAGRWPGSAEPFRRRRARPDLGKWRWLHLLEQQPSPEAIAWWEKLLTLGWIRTPTDWREHLLTSRSVSLVVQPPATAAWRSDPLSDPYVVGLALSIHPQQWRRGGMNRAVARRAMEGVVPDQVRLRNERGMQGADGDALFARNPASMADTIRRLRRSQSARALLDADALDARLMTAAWAGPQGYPNWAHGLGRALGYGLFAAWWDSECRLIATPMAQRGTS